MLTHEDTESVAARYAEERARFEQVAGEVHRRVINLLQGHVLKSVVTSRAKSVESLKRTLWRDRAKWTIEHFNGGLAPPLEDLAGVRVLLYQDADVDPTKDALLGVFPALKRKDKRSETGYSAFHVVVHEWCDEGDGAADLRCLPCEIQICTIVDHVWNELEHDIKYKQPGGRPDVGQDELLTSLRAELSLSASTVKRLMERTHARSRSNEELLSGAHDLRWYLGDRFGRRVDGPFEELWEFLSRLVARISPRAVDDLFAQGRTEVVSEAVRDEFDPDAAHREVGLAAVMLLPAFPLADIHDAIGDNPAKPLWRFMLRVAGRDAGAKP